MAASRRRMHRRTRGYARVLAICGILGLGGVTAVMPRIPAANASPAAIWIINDHVATAMNNGTPVAWTPAGVAAVQAQLTAMQTASAGQIPPSGSPAGDDYLVVQTDGSTTSMVVNGRGLNCAPTCDGATPLAPTSTGNGAFAVFHVTGTGTFTSGTVVSAIQDAVSLSTGPLTKVALIHDVSLSVSASSVKADAASCAMNAPASDARNAIATMTYTDINGTPLVGYMPTLSTADNATLAVGNAGGSLLATSQQMTTMRQSDMTVSAEDAYCGVMPGPATLTATPTPAEDTALGVPGGFSRNAIITVTGTGSWSPAGQMSMNRMGTTATLLLNGRVLVTGGTSDGVGVTASAELYDPQTNTWSAAASMSKPRLSHTATLLRDGNVLVVGGQNATDGYLADAEIYHPASNTWTPAASMSAPHAVHTATLLADGRVLVVGGQGHFMSFLIYVGDAEVYDPVANTWSAAGSVVNGVAFHTATRLANGKVLVAGGFNLTGDQSTAYLYDPVQNQWSSTAPMSVARSDASAALLPDGNVLVAGGDTIMSPTTVWSSAEIYHPSSDTWTTAAGLREARAGATATLLADGTALVASGSPDAPTSGELYDAGANAWSSAAPMFEGRVGAVSTLLFDGTTLVVGGHDPNSQGPVLAADAERYTPAAAPPVDSDNDGYSNGLEIALGHDPFSRCVTMRADVNGDGKVSITDLSAIAIRYNQLVPPAPARLDQNGDAKINILDLALPAGVYNRSVGDCP